MTNNTTLFSEWDYNISINKKETEITEMNGLFFFYFGYHGFKEVTKMNGLFFFILGIMVFDYVSSHRMNK